MKIFIPRIRLSVLQDSIMDDGLVLPSVHLYYHAAILSAVVQWWDPQNEVNWALEHLDSPIPLSEWLLLKLTDR